MENEHEPLPVEEMETLKMPAMGAPAPPPELAPATGPGLTYYVSPGGVLLQFEIINGLNFKPVIPFEILAQIYKQVLAERKRYEEEQRVIAKLPKSRLN